MTSKLSKKNRRDFKKISFNLFINSMFFIDLWFISSCHSVNLYKMLSVALLCCVAPCRPSQFSVMVSYKDVYVLLGNTALFYCSNLQVISNYINVIIVFSAIILSLLSGQEISIPSLSVSSWQSWHMPYQAHSFSPCNVRMSELGFFSSWFPLTESYEYCGWES